MKHHTLYNLSLWGGAAKKHLNTASGNISIFLDKRLLLADSRDTRVVGAKFGFGSTAAKDPSMDAGSGPGQKAVIQVA
jgi:hypothetical protein